MISSMFEMPFQGKYLTVVLAAAGGGSTAPRRRADGCGRQAGHTVTIRDNP